MDNDMDNGKKSVENKFLSTLHNSYANSVLKLIEAEWRIYVSVN